MKKKMLSIALLTLVGNLFSGVMAQTARRFTLNNSADGKSILECYLPSQPSGRAIVDCPGGGYSHLSMQNEGHDWANFFNSQGIAYFVLTYRMPHGDRNIPLSDAYNAMRTVRDSAQTWHINPYDVGIMGFSAGGHLASTVSTHAPWDARPDFSILFYPVVSMNERDTHKGSVMGFLGDQRTNQSLVREYSNFNAVRCHTTPPAIILLANDDRAVPPVTNGIAYYSAMRQAGNECALHVYPTGGHGFGFRKNYAFHNQMLADLTAWLNARKAPRADAIRVACIGNSITEGFGIEMQSQLGYPARLQQLLGNDYHVKNFGVSAHTLLNKGDNPYMNRPEWKGALAFQPNIVVIKLGTNDSKTENWVHGNEFAADLQQMFDSIKALPSQPRIFLATPIPAYKPTWNINDSVIANAIIPTLQKAAKKNNCEIIDLHASFNNEDGKQMQRDGIHPTEQGAAQIAQLVADELKKPAPKPTKKSKKK